MMKIDYPEGATPLRDEELRGLIPTHIATRPELDRFEQENINEALAWVEDRRPKNILNASFLKTLHKRMFCNVWKWAGTFRPHETTPIGVDVFQISTQLMQLLGDVEFWIKSNDPSEDEIAVRFHHRLVWIHLFPNGNGRHARLVTDILLENVLGRPIFTWGSKNLAKAGKDRTTYIESLQAADSFSCDYKPLLEFARS